MDESTSMMGFTYFMMMVIALVISITVLTVQINKVNSFKNEVDAVITRTAIVDQSTEDHLNKISQDFYGGIYTIEIEDKPVSGYGADVVYKIQVEIRVPIPFLGDQIKLFKASNSGRSVIKVR